MSVIQPTATSESVKTKGDIRRVCFVCTGNTCRSPMAAAVANAMAWGQLVRLPDSVRALALPKLEAFSAGIFAHDGEPIAENAVLALENAKISPVEGKDYHNHTAHTLTEHEADSFDLLIGLTREHAMALMIRFPQLAQRITVFPTDIADPYGGSPQRYAQCLEQISDGVRNLLFSEESPQ